MRWCRRSSRAGPSLHGGSRRGGTALAAYDRQMRRRFLAKDAVSSLVQAFLGRPRLFEYAARRVARVPPSVRRWAS